MARDMKPLQLRTYVILGIILVLGVFVYLRMGDRKGATGDGGSGANTAEPKEVLAQCLTDKGVKMYGASWCPHCAQQKKDFGSAFKKVTYVECAVPGDPRSQTQICKDNKISGYPTWRFADGSELTGEQTLDALAQKAGCTYGDVKADTAASAPAVGTPEGNPKETVPSTDGSSPSAGGPRAQ